MKRDLDQSLEGIGSLIVHLQTQLKTLEENYQDMLTQVDTLKQKSAADDLTGLSRRNAFFDRLQNLWRDKGPEEFGGILMIDIDFFKKINDTFGHVTGDAVIRSVAELLKKFESSNCIVARYGGEEFVIGMTGDRADFLNLAETIRKEAELLTGPVLSENGDKVEKDWSCTLSIGVAFERDLEEGNNIDMMKLILAADQALYSAKESGRNQVCSAKCTKAA